MAYFLPQFEDIERHSHGIFNFLLLQHVYGVSYALPTRYESARLRLEGERLVYDPCSRRASSIPRPKYGALSHCCAHPVSAPGLSLQKMHLPPICTSKKGVFFSLEASFPFWYAVAFPMTPLLHLHLFDRSYRHHILTCDAAWISWWMPLSGALAAVPKRWRQLLPQV